MTTEQRQKFGTPTEDKLKKLGGKSRKNIERGLPALGTLVEKVQKSAKKRGMILYGLDGRPLKIRGLHSALNTVIQSSGAVIMKEALIIADDDAQAQGLIPGQDYEFVANIHDEYQAEARPEVAEQLGFIFENAISRAGESLGFRCPLAGSSDVGNNWAETH